MNRLLGYSLTTAGIIAFIFFITYEGNSIPAKELWFVISCFTIFIGICYIARQEFRQLYSSKSHSSETSRINQLKLSADIVKVTLENAEIKSKTFQEEISKDGIPSRSEMPDALYDDNRNYRSREVRNIYILFYKQYSDKTYRYMSQSTRHNVDTIKQLIKDRNGINLYIDHNDPTNYYFDLPY